MKNVGTYKGTPVLSCTPGEYWRDLSLHDRARDDRLYLIGDQLIDQGYVVAKIIGGYIEEVRPYRYERPAKYEPKVNIGFAYEPPKTKAAPTKEEPAQRGLRAHTNILDEECAGCEILTSKTIDEYLASKKSVDYFLEEIKKEASSN